MNDWRRSRVSVFGAPGMATKGQALSFKAGWICLFSIVCLIWVVSKLFNRPVPPPRIIVSKAPPRRDIDFRIDLLLQAAATPGKVIHATQGGKDVLTYTCSNEDAAVALFTMRDKATGDDVIPAVEEAKDKDGRPYNVTLQVTGSVNVLTLKKGFPTQPESVSVAIRNIFVQKGRRSSIQFRNISPPKRVLPPPTRIQAQEGEKIVQVKAYDDTASLSVVPAATPPGGFARTSLLALSYSDVQNPMSGTAFMGLYLPPMTPYYCKAVDSAKLRVDQFKPVSSIVTFAYKDAKVVQANGKNFVWLPTPQTVGLLAGCKVSMSNRLPYKKPAPSKKPIRDEQEIDLRFTPETIPKSIYTEPSQGNINGSLGNQGGGMTAPREAPPDPVQIEPLDISPSVADLGLDSLRIAEVGGNVQLIDTTSETNIISQAITPHGYPAKTFKVFYAGQRSSASHSLIPELKIRIRMTQYVRAFSKTVVVPVHHFALFRSEMWRNARTFRPTGSGTTLAGR